MVALPSPPASHFLLGRRKEEEEDGRPSPEKHLGRFTEKTTAMARAGPPPPLLPARLQKGKRGVEGSLTK